MRTCIAFLQLVLWLGRGHGSPAAPTEVGPTKVGHGVHASAPHQRKRPERKTKRKPKRRDFSARTPWTPPPSPPGSKELAFTPAALYFPRFDTGNPDDSLEFDLKPSGSVLRVGRWSDAGFTSDPGTVSQVSFYEAPAETVATREWSEVTWRPLGDGKFNQVSGRWELPFAPPAGDPYKAHVFVAEFHDLSAPADAGQLFARAFGISPDASTLAPQSPSAPITVRVWPSPARAGARVTVELASAAGRSDGFEVGVYDVMGRRVAVLGRGLTATPSGSTRVTWDGRGSDGRTAAPAVYFVVASRPGDHESAQRQLVVVP